MEFTPVDGVPGTAVTTTFTLSDTSSAGPTSLTNQRNDDGYGNRHGAERDREHGDLAERICVGVGYAERWRDSVDDDAGVGDERRLITAGSAGGTLMITYAGPGTPSGTGLSGTAAAITR